MTFIVTFLIAVSILIIRSFWKAYKEPAAILGRQAANMNWVAVGQVKDSDGYNNVRYVRDGMEAVVSFQEGNVSLVHPINDTFNDFEELEQSLANVDNEMSNEEALNFYADVFEEVKNDVDNWGENEEPMFQFNVEPIKDFDDWDEDDAYFEYLQETYYTQFRRFSRNLDDGESYDAVEEWIKIDEKFKESVNKLLLIGFENKIESSDLALMLFEIIKLYGTSKDLNNLDYNKCIEEISTLAFQLNNNSEI